MPALTVVLLLLSASLLFSAAVLALVVLGEIRRDRRARRRGGYLALGASTNTRCTGTSGVLMSGPSSVVAAAGTSSSPAPGGRSAGQVTPLRRDRPNRPTAPGDFGSLPAGVSAVTGPPPLRLATCPDPAACWEIDGDGNYMLRGNPRGESA